jgi:cold shock CspA family protein
MTESTLGPRSVGVITKFDQVRGYGWITPLDGSEPIFLHHSDLPKEYRERWTRSQLPGQTVSFALGRDSHQRPKAVECLVVNPDAEEQNAIAAEVA